MPLQAAAACSPLHAPAVCHLLHAPCCVPLAACHLPRASLLLQLLTDVYKIDPSRLYVTYFAGNDELALPVDDEVQSHDVR